MNQRLNDAGMPQLSRKQKAAWQAQMRRERRPIIFNRDKGWGLADESLQETVIMRWEIIRCGVWCRQGLWQSPWLVEENVRIIKLHSGGI